MSFVVGLITTEFVANTLSIMSPDAEKMDASLGVLIASAFAMRWFLLFCDYIEIKAENINLTLVLHRLKIKWLSVMFSSHFKYKTDCGYGIVRLLRDVFYDAI